MQVDAITLDWDGATASTVARRLRAIARHQNVGTILYRRSSRKGWHVRVSFSSPVVENTAWDLRRRWWDDGQRVGFDKARRGLDGERERAVKGVLWDEKQGRYAGKWFKWRRSYGRGTLVREPKR